MMLLLFFIVLLVLTVKFLNLVFEVCELLASDIYLLVELFEKRFGVLGLGEEAHIVAPGCDLLFLLLEGLHELVALGEDTPAGA